MSKVSVIIPSRNSPYIVHTVSDILAKAAGDIEVIVTLDGYMPEKRFPADDRLKLIHLEEPRGMRHGINNMVGIAQGDYILKCDDHVCFGKGFDEILQMDMEPDWLVTPTRYRLDVNRYDRYGEPIEYLYVTFPYNHDKLYGRGFHGKKWIGEDGIGKDMGKKQYYWMETTHADTKIDDIQAMQGSGWFTSRDHFKNIGGLDEVHSSFFQEANEMVFKTWMIGGRVVVNKNTWYAHWHKSGNPGMGLSLKAKHETERFHTWLWMNDKWPKAKRTMKWFADDWFHPLPTWPKDWERYVLNDNGFRIFDENGNDGFNLGDL